MTEIHAIDNCDCENEYLAVSKQIVILFQGNLKKEAK